MPKTKEEKRLYMKLYMAKRRKEKKFLHADKERKRVRVICQHCKNEYSRGYMYKHKKKCPDKPVEKCRVIPKDTRAFLLMISDTKRFCKS